TEQLSMACHPSGSGSYTVVIIPLKTSVYSVDALRFYLWVRIEVDLEKEKDALWSGLEILEKARLWYLHRLEENRARQDSIESRSGFASRREDGAELGVCPQARSCLLRSRIQRVNGSLGSVMSEPNAMSSSNSSLPEAAADRDIRWHNSVLTQVKKHESRRRQIKLMLLHYKLSKVH
uniref:Suppressor APC domain containing 1 n=1 Tax=Amphilophus citrinellus TaxID=61819 RepID=A0A3Q0RQL3_AMPCI